MTTPAALATLPEIKSFVLAGNATFTLVSKKTGDRKTFHVEVAPERKPEQVRPEWLRADGTVTPGFFVRLLNGPDNGSDYRYLGFLFETRSGLHNLKINKDGWGEEAAASFSWLLRAIDDPMIYSDKFAEQAEFWHVGTCGRCGRDLTDPESIARGLGPVCAEKSM